jgi:hypothetical protein
MSTDLYDLLVGHEVGHAWETPAEGWHNALNGQKRGFKSYLNVVEDARIERCIKSRYPGLRSCFYKAYKGLADKDFFGIAEREISTLNLIDRINLHFKIGPFLAVPFDTEEQFYIKQIENLSNWDDVVRVATELYNRRKQELEDEYYDNQPRRGTGEIQDYEEGDEYDEYDDDNIPLLQNNNTNTRQNRDRRNINGRNTNQIQNQNQSQNHALIIQSPIYRNYLIKKSIF